MATIYKEYPFIWLSGLTDRQCEMAVYLNVKYPMVQQESTGPQLPLPQFVDVNPSLPRLVASKPETFSPGSTELPTLTSGSTIIMRYIPTGRTAPTIRALIGKELFAITGWTDDMWKDGDPRLHQGGPFLAHQLKWERLQRLRSSPGSHCRLGGCRRSAGAVPGPAGSGGRCR